MDYLALCKRLREVAGISGTGPASITGQTGEMARVVNWIQQAWLELQSTRTDWPALWRSATVPVPAGVDALALPDDLRTLMSRQVYFNGGRLEARPWSQFPRDRGESSHPLSFSLRPDGKLVLRPWPVEAGELAIEYFARPQVLTLSTDEPWLPEHLQMAIVYLALSYYATYEDAPEIYREAIIKGEQFARRMTNELLPNVTLEGPLA